MGTGTLPQPSQDTFRHANSVAFVGSPRSVSNPRKSFKTQRYRTISLHPEEQPLHTLLPGSFCSAPPLQSELRWCWGIEMGCWPAWFKDAISHLASSRGFSALTSDTYPSCLVTNFGDHWTHARLLLGNSRGKINKMAAPGRALFLRQRIQGLSPNSHPGTLPSSHMILLQIRNLSEKKKKKLDPRLLPACLLGT